MLATMADIVFVVDESGSDTNTNTQEWLAELVVGGDTLSLAEQLQAQGIDDVRFGLVGLGEGSSNGLTGTDERFDVPRYAHSQLMISGGSSSLFIDPAGPNGTLRDSDDVSAATFRTVFDSNLADVGSGKTEDGWDALEHVVAEYDFRDGAVPVVVLVQNDQGRLDVNDTLTHRGVLAALQSKNVVLNSVVAGELFVNGEPIGPGDPDPSEPLSNPTDAEFDWAPIFDLAQYETASGDFTDLYVLGVESDAADGVADRQHDFLWYDTNTANTTADVPTTTTSDALQISFNGSNTGATGMVGSGKSILIGEGITGGIGGMRSVL